MVGSPYRTKGAQVPDLVPQTTDDDVDLDRLAIAIEDVVG